MKKQEEIEIQIRPAQGEVVIFYPMPKESGTPIGSAIVCIYRGSDYKVRYTEVLHINIDKDHQGKGYAQILVQALQHTFDYLITGWSGSTSEGQSLFLKMGFEVKKPLNKKGITTLEWKKK